MRKLITVVAILALFFPIAGLSQAEKTYWETSGYGVDVTTSDGEYRVMISDHEGRLIWYLNAAYGCQDEGSEGFNSGFNTVIETPSDIRLWHFQGPATIFVWDSADFYCDEPIAIGHGILIQKTISNPYGNGNENHRVTLSAVGLDSLDVCDGDYIEIVFDFQNRKLPKEYLKVQVHFACLDYS